LADVNDQKQAELANLTDCGLPGIQRIPYGMHACHFYPDRAQLVEALVPYFMAGLRNNERCLWVTAPPLPAPEAERALQTAWDGVNGALARGALRILDHAEWYAGAAGLKGTAVADLWLKEEERALAEGYQGLRIAGNTSFLKQNAWAEFMEYERLAGERFYGRRIVALCSYTLQGRNAHDISEVMHAHACTFERPDATWQVAPKTV
jgi:two-component system, sensor histidine kinase PdtaS